MVGVIRLAQEALIQVADGIKEIIKVIRITRTIHVRQIKIKTRGQALRVAKILGTVFSLFLMLFVSLKVAIFHGKVFI